MPDPKVRDMLLAKVDDLTARMTELVDEVRTVTEQLEPERAHGCRNPSDRRTRTRLRPPGSHWPPLIFGWGRFRVWPATVRVATGCAERFPAFPVRGPLRVYAAARGRSITWVISIRPWLACQPRVRPCEVSAQAC
jgi:hypothetical protein